jgi:hypothetical protein
VTAELYIHLEDPVSYKSNIHSTGAIAKLLITQSNAQMRNRWCHDNKTCTSDNQTPGNGRVIWSDKSSFTLFPTSGRVYVWRTPNEAYNSECLVQREKRGEGSVIIWAAMLWYSAIPIITLYG